MEVRARRGLTRLQKRDAIPVSLFFDEDFFKWPFIILTVVV